MFLVAENLIGKDPEHGLVFLNEQHPKHNHYALSDAKKWCADLFRSHFTKAEQEAILPTYKSDAAYVKTHIWELNGGKTREGKCGFDPADNILDGDRLFLLSTEEADSKELGFSDENSRIATFNGKVSAWWLRSPHDPSFPIDVGIVFFNGWLLDFVENKDNVFGKAPVCMRPALNLDLSKVVGAKEVCPSDGKDYREWILDLEGEDQGENQAVGKETRYTFGVRVPIEKSKEPPAFIQWFTRLGLTIFLCIVDFVRGKKDEAASSQS